MTYGDPFWFKLVNLPKICLSVVQFRIHGAIADNIISKGKDILTSTFLKNINKKVRCPYSAFSFFSEKAEEPREEGVGASGFYSGNRRRS